MNGTLHKIKSQWWVSYFSPPTVNPSTGYINSDSHFTSIPVYPQSIDDPKFSTYWVEGKEVEFEKVEHNKPGSSYNSLPHPVYAKITPFEPPVDVIMKGISDKEIEERAKEHGFIEHSFFTKETCNQKRLSFYTGVKWAVEQLKQGKTFV